MLNNKINWQKQFDIEVQSLTEISKKIGQSDDYYVYIIWKMYEDHPIPFYIGKGHYQRIARHEMNSEFPNNIYKTRIINKHKKLGIECGYSIVHFFGDENAALSTEVDLIALIGRADLNQGPLANKTDGGDGTLGHFAPKGGNSHSARPVIANGKRYSCLKDAGSALKIDPGTVAARIKNGWKGYYYENEGQRAQSKIILGRYRKPVMVLGQKFISASDASRKLNMDIRMIAKRIKYGWKGYYYLEDGQLPRRTTWGKRKDKVAVVIRGQEFSTVAEAVKATGESMAMISKRCLSSNFKDYSRLDGKFIAKSCPPKNPEAVFVNETYFESIGKAAIALDITTGGVTYRCKSKNYPNWRFANIEKQNKESL